MDSLWNHDYSYDFFGFFPSVETDEEFSANYRDILLYPIPLTLCILLLHHILEKYCFNRLGTCFHLKHVKVKKPQNNVILEKAFKEYGNKWNHRNVISLAKKTESSERQVQRWLRLRKLYEKPSPLQKFSDCCWLTFFLLNILFYGLVILWSKPWFWNLDYCWDKYPNQKFTGDIWSYFEISVSFYWSRIVTELFRWNHMCHSQLVYNASVVSVLSISWMCNTYRIGVIVLLIQVVTDAILPARKILKYAKMFKPSSILRIGFWIIWGVTRFIYYPLWILHSIQFRAPVLVDKLSLGYYIMKFVLISLPLQNLLWLCIVLKSNGRTRSAVQCGISIIR